jgi:hypothetical protein
LVLGYASLTVEQIQRGMQILGAVIAVMGRVFPGWALRARIVQNVR